MKTFNSKIALLAIGFLGLIFASAPFFTSASSIDGTIDGAYKYAWGENIGWVNFGTANGNIHITDVDIAGYAWNDTFGWINLGPPTSGVKNNNNGKLSGYAWSSGLGWIDFGNVEINSNGDFTGYANSANFGKINFSCGNCRVRTDWRPANTRGMAMPIAWLNPPNPPSEGFAISIANGANYTGNTAVSLNLSGGSDTERMAVSNFSDFRDTGQESYTATKDWDLCKGQEDICGKLQSGELASYEFIVYAKFYTSWGKSSDLISDKIIYQKKMPIVEKIKEIPEKIAEGMKKIPELIKEIPKIFEPELIEIKPAEAPIGELVQKEAPLSMKGRWTFLSYTLANKPFTKFTLAPLPKGIRNLAQKFPTLEKTLEKTGISNATDALKFENVKLTLPGLTERVGLPTTKVEPGRFALPQGVPVVDLSPSAKQQLPSEVIFARTGGELIDFNSVLIISEKGEPQQKINTISGKSLQLVVKMDKPVKSVKGYMIFKSRNLKNETHSSNFKLQDLAASLFFALPSFAKIQEKPVIVEEEFVLVEFEYIDPDGDGIYTADIQTPLVDGEYEIITVMDFEDPELGKKEIRLITVVDPEGYLYEKDGDKETRIPGAIVSLYWLNPETKQYELWPAKEYQQENPQTTDVRGTYSFLVPEGYYYLKAETPGYLVYDGKPFQVKGGSGIHVNIELNTKHWWKKIFSDWQVTLLVIAVILLIYNFYRDKMREKALKTL